MDRMTKFLFVISLDGLSTLDFEYISQLPNFKTLLNSASYSKKVYSVYPSLTYPAHASIVTGKYPKNHGIINNTLLLPNMKSPDWYWFRHQIKCQTFYDLAIDNGMKVAALLWPVTAKSRIQYNMPEIFANRHWQNQTLVSLLNGSPIYQYKLDKEFGYLRDRLKQPNLDNFTHQSLLYTIKHKRPDLTLVHYTDLDTIRHQHGFHSREAKQALERHDSRIGDIVDALKANGIYEDSTIVILGDHSSLDENKIINLNVLLKENGYIRTNRNGFIKSYKAIVKNCDGSAYLYVKNNDPELITQIYNLINDFNRQHNCIESIFSQSSAIELGADPECALMLEASTGFYFQDKVEGKIIEEIPNELDANLFHYTKSTHGYSPFKIDYTTVFIAAGRGIKTGVIIDEMNLVDEGPTMAKLLGVQLTDTDGRILHELLVD
ncbi:MAG: ectonucleotide pyrophosphatase/phosphodiesterase [Bacillota bacterium]|nr:ectonucleotide pyrophosphatase/phosphodiesterase [Bacillota bacterium]